MRQTRRRLFLVVCAAGLFPWTARGTERLQQPTSFAAEIARLSEPEGTFDGDNLISNEASYLDAVPALGANQVSGGAYIGVGPDQNFTYIARIRPDVAYIIDIRRDNLLLHLLFKALFAEARTRAEYLSLLTGRPAPLGMERWKKAGVEEVVKHVDDSTPWPDTVRGVRDRVDRRIAGFGVPLSRADLDSIDRFHRRFIAEGLDLVFAGHGPTSRIDPTLRYPTLRDLLLAEDGTGRKGNYLASEDDFQFVKSLHAADAIVPVVGDVSGPRALNAIGAAVARRQLRVTAFYLSNVEFYLARDGRLGRLIDNLSRLPRGPRSVIIRSVFSGGSSVSLVQTIDQVLGEAGTRD